MAMTQKSPVVIGLLGLASAFLITPAQAADASATLNVQAKVVGTCSVAGGTLDFGTYSKAANSDATATISYSCTPAAAVSIGLGLGANTDGLGQRFMSNGSGGTLPYSLYKEAGRTNQWGDAGDGSLSSLKFPASSGGPATVFGRIESGFNPPAGDYSDQVLITLTITG